MSEEPFNFLKLLDFQATDIARMTTTQKIEVIEYLLEKNFPNIADDLPVANTVFGGVYTRELFIPKGTLLTGKIHFHDHLAMLKFGDLSVMGPNGIMRLTDPIVFHSLAGAKRIGYAHEDSVFMTMHRTDKTEIDEIEAELFGDSDLSWVPQFLGDAQCQRQQ